jgi:hypothetical protein
LKAIGAWLADLAFGEMPVLVEIEVKMLAGGFCSSLLAEVGVFWFGASISGVSVEHRNTGC